MLRRTGQVAGFCVRHTLHLIAEIVLGVLLLVIVAGGILAWRLAEGPINLAFLIPRVETAFNKTDAPQLSIGAAALGWEGFRSGVESPVDLVFADVVLRGRTGAGVAMIPRAEVSLSAPELLIGRIVPRRIVIEDPKVRIVRDKEGHVAIAFGERRQPAAPASSPSPATADLIADVLTALNAPPGNDQSPPARRLRSLSQLRILSIHGAELSVDDEALGATWYAPNANLTLTRGELGGLTGSGEITLAVRGRQAVLSLQAGLGEHNGFTVAASLSPVRPAELATIFPRLGPLSPVNAPVTLHADLESGGVNAAPELRLGAEIGAGEITFGGEAVPIEGGAMALTASEDEVALRQLVLRLAGPDEKPGPVLSVSGSAIRLKPDEWSGNVSVDTGGVNMGELARYWPPEIAHWGRVWVTGNITAGTADTATLALDFTAAPDAGSFELTRIDGHVAAHGLTAHWLRPVPPLTDGTATLSITGPDAITIDVAQASQGPLSVSGQVTITGLAAKEQEGAITARVRGPLPAVLGLLGERRINLLARYPVPFTNPAGETDTTITVALPLDARVTMSQIRMSANAALTGVHLGSIFAGRDFDQGTLQLAADNAGMKISGNGNFASIPTRFSYALDFAAGAPGGIVQTGQAEARASTAQLAALGIGNLGGALAGNVDLATNFSEARDGAGKADVTAGLTDAALTIAGLGFTKQAGSPAEAHASIAFAGGKIQAVDGFGLTGPNLALAGAASFSHGRPMFVRIDRADIGRTDAHGSVRFPSDGEPIAVVLSGTMLDLSARFARQHKGAAPKPAAAAKPPERGPPWVFDAQFGQALLANGQVLADCRLHAESNGAHITAARLSGNLASGHPLTLAITPEAGGRALSLSTGDAGALLSAMDITRDVRDGALSISGRYDDSLPGTPLSGSAEMSDFRVLNAPALARVLQAMTLYGLAQVIEGPGMRFSKLIAPFALAGDQLTLNDARAFNPSLGLTTKGSIDLATRTAALSGTIVPAYFFNSLLGDIPLIGRLFSPEKGGGVFAAAYTVDGSLDNPAVHVNPLAAVTPGFLRGLFSVFNEKK
ncbi:MAG TPA: AsmA-like C-terminal region-containing protein [Acetobacteraceae bacterium]|nr:AsmA-like C-terminal region-containing protein [Acetobacteraceae bacterium]